jgi:hypothetical protein
MSSKRKQILKAIALSGSATMDDLVLSTGMERKNAHDNIKATMRDALIERMRDDVTGQPAYKLTPKGRQWLEDDQDDESCVKPQAQVGTNSASKDTGSTVGSSGIGADPLPVGNAVNAPPKPDQKPVAACADDQLSAAGKTITDFCEWLAGKAKVRCPMNLWECRAIVMDLMQAGEVNADLEAMALAQAMTIKDQAAEIETLMGVSAEMSVRIALLESNAELPLQTKAEPYESQLGYAVMEYSDEDVEKNILRLVEARDKAAVHALRTGQKTAVFAIIDRVENVNVEWAA